MESKCQTNSIEKLKGEQVRQIQYGDYITCREGNIIDINNDILTVAFDNDETAKFHYPEAFLRNLIPMSNYVSWLVKEKYGKHSCYSCGIRMDSDEEFCKNCIRRIKECEICMSRIYMNSICEHPDGDTLICGCCYEHYFQNHEDEKLQLPISYKQFHDAGLDDQDYYYYISLYEEIRSWLILSIRNPMSKTALSKNIEPIISDIRCFFKEKLNIDCSGLHWISRLFDIKYDFHYYDRLLINHEEYREIESALILPRPLNHIRAHLERIIYNKCCDTNQKWIFQNIHQPDYNYTGGQFHKIPRFKIEQKEKELSNELSSLEAPNALNNHDDIDNIHRYIDSVEYYHFEEQDLNCDVEELWNYLTRDELREWFNNNYTPEFNALNHTLFVHSGNNIICTRNKHEITCVNAIVPTMHSDKVKINVNYCHDCEKFFVSEERYKEFIKKYGVIYLTFGFVNEKGDYSEPTESKKADKSPLMLCGYSVSQDKGFSSEQRHVILKNIIDRKILDKWQVIEYLEQFIRYNGLKANMDLAVSKWRSDLDFVEAYESDKQTNVDINKIEKYR